MAAIRLKYLKDRPKAPNPSLLYSTVTVISSQAPAFCRR